MTRFVGGWSYGVPVPAWLGPDSPHGTPPHEGQTSETGARVDYKVLVVDDGDLPGGVDWVIARSCAAAYLLVKRSRSTFETGLGEVMAEAWEASARCGAGVTREPEASPAWYQRRPFLAAAAGVAAALIVAVPSPLYTSAYAHL